MAKQTDERKRPLVALRYKASTELEELAEKLKDLGKHNLSPKVVYAINTENKKVHSILEGRQKKYERYLELDPGFIKDIKEGRFKPKAHQVNGTKSTD